MSANDDYTTKLVINFPYEELLNINGVDLAKLRQCLPHLLEISKNDLFYTNFKAVKITLEFTTSNLAIFDDIYAKDIFVSLLTLLNEIVLRLAACKKLHHVFPNIKKCFEIIQYISDLNVFCNYCSTLTEPVLVEAIKLVKDEQASVDSQLVGILENLKGIKADKEIAKIADVVLHKFSLESEIYRLCSHWLMQESIQILIDLDIQNIEDDEKTASILRSIHTFYKTICRAVRTNHTKSSKYDKILQEFRENLMVLSHKIIHLSCRRIVRDDARQLLCTVLYEFLTEQSIMSYKVENLIKQEIQQFSLNVREWLNSLCSSFFWLCHLLYSHKSYVWTSREIMQVLNRLIYTKKHSKLINVYTLKSVCFIYPLALPVCFGTKKRELGDDILKIIDSSYLSVLDKILSTEQSQIIWIMRRGSSNLKIAALHFWLNKFSTEHYDILGEAIKISRTEEVIFDVLACNSNVQRETAERAIELVSNLQCPSLIKNIQATIPKFTDNPKLFATLMQMCQQNVPQDNNISLSLLKSAFRTIKCISDDTVLAYICEYMKKLLISLKTEKEEIQFVCGSRSLIYFLILSLDKGGDRLVVAVLELLRKMMRYQKKTIISEELQVSINVLPLMKKSPQITEKTFEFLLEVIQVNSYVKLEARYFVELLTTLCELATENLSPILNLKCYSCLTEILKRYQFTINMPQLSGFVQDRCFYSNRDTYSSGCTKFILCWINLMCGNPDRSLCSLPDQDVLTKFILRSKKLRPTTVKRYLYFISEMNRP